MFDALNLRQRTLLLAFAPSLLLTVLLGGHFAITQLDRLHEQLIEQGRLLIEHLAPLASTPLQENDVPRLQQIANHALEQPDIRAVTLHDNQGKNLAHAGPKISRVFQPRDAQRLTVWRDFQSSIFMLPVYAHHQLGDPEPEANAPDPLLGWIEIEVSHMSALMEGYRGLLFSLAFGIFAVFLSIIFATYLARGIYQPFKTLINVISPNTPEELPANFPHFSCPDANQLAENINIILNKLKRANEITLQHTECPARIAELTQSLENVEIQSIELDLARREAVEASRMKSEFLTNMSHEIRTPLNGILGFIRQLQKTTLNNQQRDYLNTIEHSSYHLLSVINELLDMSKIEAGKFMLEPTPFNIREFIQDSLNMLAPNAHESNLELVSLIDPRLPSRLIGDVLRLQQVLNNLIGNAVKFTPVDGHVLVRAIFEAEVNNQIHLQIRVEDSGLGFLPEELRTLFRPFHQLDRNEPAQGKGTGLGLAISKKIIDVMNGDIGVESEYCHGAHFWIRIHLPIAPHQEQTPALPLALVGHSVPVFESQQLSFKSISSELEEIGLDVEPYASIADLLGNVKLECDGLLPYRLAVIGTNSSSINKAELKSALYQLTELNCKALVFCPTNQQEIYQELSSIDGVTILTKPLRTNLLHRALNELFTTTQAPAALATPEILEDAPLVLCVDDHPINLQLIKKILSDLGAKVVAVDSGQAAIDAARINKFDIIFMDIKMPEINGLEASQKIRQLEHEQGIRTPVPIVALTAHALSSERGQLLNSGMNDYLSKPVSEQQLLQTLQKWVSSKTTTPAFLENAKIQTPPTQKNSLIDSLRQQLFERLPSDLAEIQVARSNANKEVLLARVHHLHGAISVCDLPEIRQICYNIETLLKEDKPASVELDILNSHLYDLLNKNTPAQDFV